jgi:hypothetical protein
MSTLIIVLFSLSEGENVVAIPKVCGFLASSMNFAYSVSIDPSARLVFFGPPLFFFNLVFCCLAKLFVRFWFCKCLLLWQDDDDDDDDDAARACQVFRTESTCSSLFGNLDISEPELVLFAEFDGLLGFRILPCSSRLGFW